MICLWSLIVVISIKYATLIMRADNHGEGGILALLALISPRRAKQSRRRAIMVVIGLLGATLLYGDGAITPAISVLSAIEGIKVHASQMDRAVVPLTVAILVLLFMVQRKGTSWLGGIFGPIMLVWFVVIGILGLVGIAKAPAILAALSPLPAITFLSSAGPLAFAVIGAAFLAVTGGEAFYADMGHFGPFPIRLAWFGVAISKFRARKSWKSESSSKFESRRAERTSNLGLTSADTQCAVLAGSCAPVFGRPPIAWHIMSRCS